MTKHFCDRCKKELGLKSHYVTLPVLEHPHVWADKEFELCEGCFKDLCSIITRFVNGTN